ncbi:hypothetical protein MtrunA17_Chr7g0267091 [Medicago truncatula]|uniref:Uncharacterized protein n=1 Tax=Medicago truncatula TaxID=3880 RepID=A0A396H648_MEDTR|nr:hypothetical protein MtrunA17_Chr7g0267091 [Medicago truncatula]
MIILLVFPHYIYHSIPCFRVTLSRYSGKFGTDFSLVLKPK